MVPDRPLRVCLPIGFYPPAFSGMGLQIQRIRPFLRVRGVDLTVLTHRLPGSSAPAPQEKETEGVDRILAAGSSPVPTLQRVLRFRSYFERRHRSFDLVHSDTLGWEFLLNVRRLKALGLQVIVEMVLLDGDDPVTTSRERFGAFKLRQLQSVDIWIGICGAFLPRVLAAGIPGERFRLVYPGVDVQAYRPLTPGERRETRARLGLPLDSRIAISVGSVIPRKGADRLLAAWTRMAPVRGRDLLLIVGPMSLSDGLSGSDLDVDFVRRVRDASSAPEIEGTVRLIGRADNVNEYFGASDLFLFLSRQEGLPIVSVEALASGLPCVVSPLDGIGEIVADGKSGFIVPDPDDAGAVSALVSRLLDRPGELSAMGEHARRTALTRFSFEARADALVSIYREVTAAGGRSNRW